MNKLVILASAMPLALGACDASAPAGGALSANAAAPGANASTAKAGEAAAAPVDNAASASADETLRTETVTGTFTGWDLGDYLWANVDVPGREPFGAQPGSEVIGLFLDAHRGQQVTVEVATVRTEIPEAGGETEIQRITSARTAAADAASWWQRLGEPERAAARRRFEEGALSGR